MQGIKAKHNLEFLLEDTLQSWYWIGFILADGYINHKTNRLRICLSTVDIKTLKTFCDYINLDIKYIKYFSRQSHKYCVLQIKDTKTIRQIIKKFDIKPRKTYNPPVNISRDKPDLLLALYIGFIDGDGNIQKQTGRSDYCLAIKVHSNWINFIKIMEKDIFTILNITKRQPYNTRINNAGYCYFTTADKRILRELKNFITNNKLKIMNRKWDKLDNKYLFKLSRYEISDERTKNIKKLKAEGLNTKEISNKLKLKYSTVYNKLYRKEAI